MYYIVIGSKAEYIKMFPVLLEMDKQNIDYTFIHTGQHDLTSLIASCKTRSPDVVLTQEDGFSGNTGGAFSWATHTFKSLYKILKKERGAFIIYQGDTMSTAIAAGVAMITGNRGVHIEAGLRSGNIRDPFPEEITRRVVDLISNVCLTPSLACTARLKWKSNVFTVGNTVYDSIKHFNFTKNKKSNKIKHAVCTIHRHENIKSKVRMQKIIAILNQCPIQVNWYLHNNTMKKLKEYELLQTIDTSKIKILSANLDYKTFVPLLANSNLVITDGGGMSEEAAYFKVPALLLRMNTEREELLNTSCQILSELDVEGAKLYFDALLASTEEDFQTCPYLNDNSALKIINTLEGMAK